MSDEDPRLSTGISGLDEVLHGGLIPHRSYLLRGGPGSGKTTLGMHYLTEAIDEGALFVTLGETEAQLRSNGRRLGLPMDEINVLDLSPGHEGGGEDNYSLLESWDAEGTDIHKRITTRAEELQPARVFVDSITHMRYLSADTFQYRKQIMSMLRRLTLTGATVLFTAEESGSTDDDVLHFLSDGILTLRSTKDGRLCHVQKFRGSGFAEDEHHYRIDGDGLTVFPRLWPGEHSRSFTLESISSGVPELDELSHGGIERGTATLMSGPTGVGKTTLAAQYMKEAASRGERSVIYSFDEGSSTFFHRCQRVGIPVDKMVETGNLRFEAIEPLHYNPDHFSTRVRHEIEENGTTIVLIDSLSGYRQSVRSDDLQVRVHALCRYLVNMGVTVLLVNETFTITGGQMRVTEDEISYLADTIFMLRYLEIDGEIRKTIGVLKKRTGDFERSLRELEITPHGLKVGQPLTRLRGILSGIPEPREQGHVERQ